MKGRESGMPDATYWNSFFDATGIMEVLGCAPGGQETVVEFGSGYGTFTLPLARRTTGMVYALDIEPELVKQLQDQATAEGLTGVRVQERDFVTNGTGLPDGSVDHVMLYNLLHIEEPVALLREAHRVLRPGGTASIIHWRRDIPTPRGPSLAIRPDPEQCREWAESAGFDVEPRDISAHASYHYGLWLRPRQ